MIMTIAIQFAVRMTFVYKIASACRLYKFGLEPDGEVTIYKFK